MKNILVILSILTFGCSTNSDNYVKYKWIGKGSATGEHFTLGKIKSVDISVLNNFEEKSEYYGEGVLTLLTFPDSASIGLHIGFLMTLPCANYKCNIDSVSNNYQTERSGNIIGKYWREIKLKDFPITIYYHGVNELNIHKYDKVLESLNIERI